MKKEIVLITGGSGLLATRTTQMLQDDYTIRLLTTNKKKIDRNRFYYWNIKNRYVDVEALKECQKQIAQRK